MGALPYTLALLVPAMLLSFWAGNKVGALAARRKSLDNTVLPVGYVLTATPQMWLGIVLVWLFASTLALLAGLGRRTASDAAPGRSSTRAASRALDPAVLALFLVAFGGWAIGMRNIIIYELEADYSNYLAALGAPQSSSASTPTGTRCCRRSRALRSRSARSWPARSWSRSSSRIRPRHAHALGDPEPRLLPDPGDLPLRDHRRAAREPDHRHRLRLHRPATRIGMQGGSMAATPAKSSRPACPSRSRSRPAPSSWRRRPAPRVVHFALRNWKFVFGAASCSSCCSSRSSGRCSPRTSRSSSARRPTRRRRRTTGSARPRSARTSSRSS